VVSLVRSSMLLDPRSLVTMRSGAAGVTGGVVSTVIESGADAGDVLPAGSVDELVIDQLPSVTETAVVGVPDDVTGEAVVALVVPISAGAVTADEVAAHCAEKLARFKCPTTIRIVPALPHSATGRVAKGRLREVYGESGYGS